jgi:hypothetical protein
MDPPSGAAPVTGLDGARVPERVNPLLFEYRKAVRIIADPGHSRDDRA